MLDLKNSCTCLQRLSSDLQGYVHAMRFYSSLKLAVCSISKVLDIHVILSIQNVSRSDGTYVYAQLHSMGRST